MGDIYRGYEVCPEGDGTFCVKVGDKVVSTGWATVEFACNAIDTRRRHRKLKGLPPIG